MIVLGRGEHIIYGSQFNEYREVIFKGMIDGTLEVTLDYNRVSWDADKPEDKIIYRVYMK